MGLTQITTGGVDDNINIDSNTLKVDGTNNRVGIGTSSPTTPLQVHSSTTASTIRITNPTSGATSSDGLIIQESGNDAYIWNKENSFISLGTNNAERMRIDSSGNVGIGTSSPSVLLHVNESTGAHANLILQNSEGSAKLGTNSNIFYVESSQHIFYNSGGTTEYARIDSSGNVGIGTTSMPHKLCVDGNIQINSGSDVRSNSSGGTTQIQGGATFPGGNILLGGGSGTNDIRFRTSGASSSSTERARIDSSGRLLAGTTSSSGNFRAVFQGNSGNSSAGGDVVLARGAATPANAQALGLLGFSDSTHTASGVIQCNRDGGTWSGSSKPTLMAFQTCGDGSATPTERMRIQSDGTVGIGFSSPSCKLDVKVATSSSTSAVLRIRSDWQATSQIQMQVLSDGDVENRNNSYGSISDAKLKENIVDANSQWEDIKNLRVRNYNFIVDEDVPVTTHIGVVAQETELVSPGLVKESPDVDADGNDLGTVTKSVRYSVLYMKAVKALQEAMDRIETLETKVAALEAAE